MLTRLGLDRLSEKVYKALIAGRHQGVDELAAALGQPEGEIRTALEQLEKLDLLRPFGDGIGQVVDPRLGLQSLLLQQISEINARVRAFDQDRIAVLGLIDQHTDLPSGSGEPDSSYVAGREAVTARLRELASTVDTEWLAFIPGGAPSVSWLETALSLVRQVQDRGVKARTVFTDSIRADTREALRATWQDELGCWVRTVPSLPVHLLVVDRSVALLPADPCDPWRGVMQISTPGALVAITALFEGVWDNAVPLGTSTQPDEHELTSRERELLRLLARGLTDDVIRRQLGVSLRTVRRVVADLCARLQAESRFEAGYQAAKRGWI